ncbi:DUF4271 domain-containing protein [Ekhidna sp.]|uniref:DUF4271 domain-containing protein n=1 Tax=Ekhidna sp. TaxID=2608089 RepID=UPI003B4FF9F0
MRSIFLLIFISISSSGFCQQDTIVIIDFTKVLIETNQNKRISPVTSLDQINRAGFFLNGYKNGSIRICNPEPLSIWTNGQLFEIIKGCQFIELENLMEKEADTVFISLSSQNSLKNLRCELVVFEELKIIKEEISMPRTARDLFQEFLIIGWIILILILGFFIYRFPSRVAYLKNKTFTFKISAYEFINTNFFEGGSIYLTIFYSLGLAFALFYLNFSLSLDLFNSPISLILFLWSWIKTAIVIFGLIVSKWAIVSIVAGLFNFKGLKNYQLFDFLNFQTFLLIPILGLILLDFMFSHSIIGWISLDAVFLFAGSLILFIIWFTLKFVNNSPRKKLMIISYLCATEIIPAIILLGLFYK